MHALKLGWLLVAVLAAGCFGREETAVRLLVRVSDDQGAAQASVPVELDGVQTATTDKEGRATVTFVARANRVQLAVHCPSGFQSPEPRSVPLPRQGRQPPLELTFACRPLRRTLLLVVRAPEAAGMPVLADGESLGNVTAEGTFHAVLQRPPEAVLRLTLDTSSAPRFVPQNPVREVRVADRDEIVVFDQALALLPPARRPSAPRRAQAESNTRSHVPYAIGARF